VLSFDCMGGMTGETKVWLQHIINALAAADPTPRSVIAGRVWSRVSIALQKSIAANALAYRNAKLEDPARVVGAGSSQSSATGASSRGRKRKPEGAPSQEEREHPQKRHKERKRKVDTAESGSDSDSDYSPFVPAGTGRSDAEGGLQCVLRSSARSAGEGTLDVQEDVDASQTHASVGVGRRRSQRLQGGQPGTTGGLDGIGSEDAGSRLEPAARLLVTTRAGAGASGTSGSGTATGATGTGMRECPPIDGQQGARTRRREGDCVGV